MSILNNKNELKTNKKLFLFRAVPCGCDVALRATWQRHVGPHGAYVAFNIFIIYLHTIYIRVFSLAYIGRVIDS